MNRPTLHEMECFVAVAEELNFSRAAQRLNLSQPPLTRQIQALESKIGCRLLVRNTRTVSLTPSGRLFLEDARAVLMRLDAAADSARRAVTGESSRLRLSFVGALLDEAMVKLLQKFRKSHPKCQIHLSDLAPAPQLEGLLAGTVDAAFVGAPPRTLHRDLQSLIWKREPLRVSLPADHRLVVARSVRLEDLREEGWVMVSRAAAPAFRQIFETLCEGKGFRPRIVQESERVAAVLTMVAASQGVSLLPAAVEKLIGEGVVFRPIAGRPSPVLEHACIFPTKPKSAELRDFLEVLRRKTV